MANISGSYTSELLTGITYNLGYNVNNSGGYDINISAVYEKGATIESGTSIIVHFIVDNTDFDVNVVVSEAEVPVLYSYTYSPSTHTTSNRDAVVSFFTTIEDEKQTDIVVKGYFTQNYSTVSAPTSATFNPTSAFEDSLVVSWTGADKGIGNPITGYQITTYVSTDNKRWSSKRTDNVNNATITFDTSSWTYAYYYRFDITTKGSYEDSSDTYTTDVIQKKTYQSATPATNLSTGVANGSIQKQITLTWTEGKGGINNELSHYNIIVYTGNTIDGTFAYTKVISVGKAYTYYQLNLIDEIDRGKYCSFEITTVCASEVAGDSQWTNAVKVNSLSGAPSLLYPKSLNSTTYNKNAFIRLQCGTDNDTTNQTYKIIDGDTTISGLSYRGTTDGVKGSGSHIAYTNDGLESGTALSYTISLLDAPWGTGKRKNKGDNVLATDLTTLRTACETLATYYNLTLPAWTDTTITAGKTVVKATHFTQIQTILKRIFEINGNSYTFSTISRNTQINHNHINELRIAIETLC